MPYWGLAKLLGITDLRVDPYRSSRLWRIGKYGGADVVVSRTTLPDSGGTLVTVGVWLRASDAFLSIMEVRAMYIGGKIERIELDDSRVNYDPWGR